jgi:hypothetical protein
MKRVAWFSPLSVEKDLKSSVFTENILSLNRDWEAEIFVSDNDWKALGAKGKAYGCPVHHFLRAHQRHKENPFDCFFFQIENNIECSFIKRLLPHFAGFVIVHDYIMNSISPSLVSKEQPLVFFSPDDELRYSIVIPTSAHGVDLMRYQQVSCPISSTTFPVAILSDTDLEIRK